MKKGEKRIHDIRRQISTPKTLFFLGLIVLTIISTILMRYIWISGIKETTDNALMLAEAAEAAFQKDTLNSLEFTPDDIEKPAYKQIKNSLSKLAALDSEISFAYIYTQKNHKIIIIADSEPAGSENYSPPGQEYTEAESIFFRPFKEDISLVSQPVTDRWGAWVSVLVPMKDPETGNNIAVFGVDYPVKIWDNNAEAHTLTAAAFVLCLYIILFAFYGVITRNIAIKKEKNKLFIANRNLCEKEELFRTIFEQSPIGISIGSSCNSIIRINPAYEKIVGRTNAEIIALGWQSFTHPEDIQCDLDNFEKFSSGEIDGYSATKRYIRPDGSIVWANFTLAPLKADNMEDQHHICLVKDITEFMQAEINLKESERVKAVLLDNLPGMLYRCSNDHEWTMLYVSEGCAELTGYKAESLLHNNEISYNSLILPEYRDAIWSEWTRIVDSKDVFRYEYKIKTASGKTKWVFEQGRGIYDDNGNVLALEGLIVDITDRKIKEEEIIYLNCHDTLTGLKNRICFESEKKKLDTDNQLPLSVILGDINGVKLINDAFGRAEGDLLIAATAEILLGCCRDGDILARTSGDEFCILLPKTDSAAAHELQAKIKMACDNYNRNALSEDYNNSISLGYSTKESSEEDFDQIIRMAENSMNKHKLLEHKSSHSAIISSIKTTMFERSQETEKHAERMAALAKVIGNELKLSQIKLYELELLATLHDIGKVGIDNHILNKPGKLTDEEWTEMKKHPAIGYRIAMSSPELVPVAEYILCHHERWDGKGYPQGLKGETIPLLSRVLAIVDSYDAMTQDRSYRKAMTREAAIEELRVNTGTQFDPVIAGIFINKVLKENEQMSV